MFGPPARTWALAALLGASACAHAHPAATRDPLDDFGAEVLRGLDDASGPSLFGLRVNGSPEDALSPPGFYCAPWPPSSEGVVRCSTPSLTQRPIELRIATSGSAVRGVESARPALGDGCAEFHALRSKLEKRLGAPSASLDALCANQRQAGMVRLSSATWRLRGERLELFDYVPVGGDAPWIRVALHPLH